MTPKELQERLREDHGNIKDAVDEILTAVYEITKRLEYLEEDIFYLDDIEETT